MTSTLSEKDLRQLAQEAQKVLDGRANVILLMKNAKGKGLFIKAADINFNLKQS